RAANPGADSPAGTINITADGPTGIINTTADGPTGIISTAADTPPVDPEICEARVGSSCHAGWLLHVIRFDLDALPTPAGHHHRRGDRPPLLNFWGAPTNRHPDRPHLRFSLQTLPPRHPWRRRAPPLTTPTRP